MTVLLDHNLPDPLRFLLVGHLARTARQKQWDLLENGELLRAAEAEFDVFLTADKDFDRHASDSQRRVAIVKLTTNHWPSLRAAHEIILAAVESSVAGSFQVVEIVQQPRRRRKK